MKKEELSDAMNEIDGDIVEEAANKRVRQEAVPKRKPIYAWVAGFTALAAAISAMVIVPRLTESNVGTEDGGTATSVTEEAPPAAQVTEDTTGSQIVAATGSEPDEHGNDFDRLTVRDRAGSELVKSVSAVDTVGDYITTDTMLRIDVNGDVTEDVLRSHIKLNGGGEFTLERGEGNSYLLSASAQFSRGDTVKLAVSDDSGRICDSYAFSTMEEFTVKSVYPFDGDTYSDPSSGVEIEFTAVPDASAAADYFEITPGTEGKLSVAKNRLVFSHDEPFTPETAYTVTVKAGLPCTDGQTLAEDKTFSFTTSVPSRGDTYFYTGSSDSGFSESFIPDDRACVEIYCSDSLKRNVEFELHLYAFGSAGDYYKAVQAHIDGKRTVDTAGLAEVYSSNEVPFSREDDSQVYVLLPENLAEGFYVADISAVGLKDVVYSLQYMVAVTPISAYSLSLGEENLFYVNSSETGLPAAGAEVTLEADGKKYSGKVGSDGLVRIVTGGETGRAVLDIKYGSSRYIDAFILSDAENVKYDDLYYTYIYTDRELYMTTDTIKVWGVLIPKSRSTPLPSDLSVMLGDIWLMNGEKTPVTVAADGTFSAEFSFKDHLSEYSWVWLQSGEDVIVSKTAYIQDYVKPEYVAELTAPDYAILPEIDPITASVDASYYEGTPAEGLVFSLSGGANTEYVTTDENGHAEARLYLQNGTVNDWRVQYGFVNASLEGIENTYIYDYKSINTFNRDVMLRYKLDEKNNLTIYTNKMDFSKADEYFEKRYTDEYKGKNAYNIMKGDTIDTEVSVVIKHYWTDEEETGSYYDYLEKKTVKRYRYVDHNTQVAAYKLTTENGKFTLYGLPFVADHGRYLVEMSYKDTCGNDVKVGFNVYRTNRGEWSESGIDGYYYSRDTRKIFYSLSMNNSFSAYDEDWERSYNRFSEDEEVGFSLKCSRDDIPVDGKLLLALYKSDFVDYKLYDMSSTDTVLYTATKELIPDANFEGAYFDGKHIYTVSGGTMYYDPSGRELVIEAASDREKYDAGDTAQITVKVTDKSGKAVGGATVHLSCVDEAAFAMCEQNADMIGGVYATVYYPRAISRASYIQHLHENGYEGGKGGGEDSPVRRDFRDTSYFGSVTTDNSGTAEFTVKLPDNLTTWRATVFAMYDTSDNRLLAGTELLPVVVSRDMIITPIMQSAYIKGDDISVSASCAGLPENGSITVSITGGNVNKEAEIRPKETANFGKLPVGEYTVTFRAGSGENGDAVEMPLSVVQTMLETNIVRGLDLADLQSGINPTRYPVTVAFFDREYMLNTRIMQRLSCYYGNNLGMRLAAAYSAVQLGYMTGQEMKDEFLSETSNGIARELPSAMPSMELTALMCSAVPEAVSREAVVPVLETYSTEHTLVNTDRCAAHMALAALGENILSETRELIDSDIIQNPVAGIYLSAALAFSGDYDGAYDAYIKYVPYVAFNDSDPDAIVAYVEGSGGDTQEITRAALITASLLDLPEAEYFARYLSSVDPEYDSYGLQLVIYLANYVPDIKGEASFTYNADGGTKTVTLERHYPTIIRFTEEQFGNADFRTVSGSVYAIVSYTGRVTENTAEQSVKVTKKLSGSMAVGEKVTVSITSEPHTLIYDVIPSCGRIYREPGNYYAMNGQQIMLYTDKDGHAEYRFTVNLAGDYIVESAVASDFASGAWGMSNRTGLKVGGADNEA